MNPQVFEKLQTAHDVEGVKKILTQVCSKFGKPSRIEILADGSSGYYCYMNLCSPAENEAVCRELDGFRFGGDVCIRIPMTLGRAA